MSISKLRHQDHYIAVTRELREAGYGWSEEFGGKHARLLIDVGGRGETVIMSITPSDHRAAANAVGDIRRRIRSWKAEVVARLATETAPAQFPTLEKETMDDSTLAAARSTDVIEVLGRQVTKVEYKGQRVVTLRQIDETHERPDGTASRQFAAHKHRHVEDTDFYVIDSVGVDEIRRHGTSLFGPSAKHGVLITERGYGKIVKGWNDELSWQLHDAMQTAYFAVRQQVSAASLAPVAAEDRAINLVADLEVKINRLIEWSERADHALSVIDALPTDRRIWNGLKHQGNVIVDAVRESGLHLSNDDLVVVLGGLKKVMTNRANWQKAGVLPVPYGEEYEFSSADEVLCLILKADAIHAKLPSWVSTNILIPHARMEGWPQRQTDQRSRSHRPIVLFPLVPSRALITTRDVREKVVRKNGQFWATAMERRTAANNVVQIGPRP